MTTEQKQLPPKYPYILHVWLDIDAPNLLVSEASLCVCGSPATWMMNTMLVKALAPSHSWMLPDVSPHSHT